MNKDTRMIAEAMHHGHPMQVIVSDLYRVHTMLNQLSTAIHMNRNAETDQLLSKIRDLADMLIADGAAENAECMHCAYAAQGCACNECAECHANHDKQTAEENAEQVPDIDRDKADLNKDHKLSAYELARAQAMAMALQKAGKKK